MHPLRIVILGILLYFLYRLVMDGIRKKRANRGRQTTTADLPAHDVLVEDPFCHTYIPKGQAVTLREGDETVYFCSESCKSSYLKKKSKAN